VRRFLTKLAPAKAVGLLITDQRVTLSQVASTPWGPVELACHTAELNGRPLDAVLEEVLNRIGGSARLGRTPIAVGVPGETVFFSTRPIQTTAKDPPPRVLLRETLQSPNITINGQMIPIDEMAVDVIKAQPVRRTVASIVACPASGLTSLVEMLEQRGVRPHRVEPAPCAMLRTAEHTSRCPRRAKVVLRVFLRETSGLAILVAGGMPMVWRSFELVKGDESSSILSVCRSLELLCKYCGVDAPIDALMIHGRTDLGPLLEFERLQQQMDVPSTWTGAPILDEKQIAFGLALGCPVKDEAAFDLARPLKPEPSFWATFPLGELAAMVLLLLAMAALLTVRYFSLQHELATLRVHNTQRPELAACADEDLENEKRDLLASVGAVRKFVSGRIAWTACLRDISAQLPDRVHLTTFEGVNESELGSGKKGNRKLKKYLTLRGQAPLEADGAIPKQIDELLDRLRTDELLQQQFPHIELADLRELSSNVDDRQVAAFNIQCLATQSPKKK